MNNNNVIIEPEFPQFDNRNGKGSPLQVLLGIIIWLGLFAVFLAVMYVNWFTVSLVSLLQMVKPKPYAIPFWFSAIVTIFFFPLTLVVILIAALLKIIRD